VNVNVNTTTFRLLIKLFAYQEVLTNHKLDRAYLKDNGASLTFYIPQLWSFLLHGAYLNADKLELFLLDKCGGSKHQVRNHLLFCHCSYWFLRAWQQQPPMSSYAHTTPMSTTGNYRTTMPPTPTPISMSHNNHTAGHHPQSALPKCQSVKSTSKHQRGDHPIFQFQEGDDVHVHSVGANRHSFNLNMNHTLNRAKEEE
jgi:hypothetical protein